MPDEPILLAFNAKDLDTRIMMRGTIEALRRDPSVFIVEEVPPSFDRDIIPEHEYVFAVVLRYGMDPSPLLESLLRTQLTLGPPSEPLRLREVMDRLGSLPNVDREALIRQALGSTEGRSRLAQSMAMPLRRNLDYQGVARRFFDIQQLPEGALPVYDRDPDPGVQPLELHFPRLRPVVRSGIGARWANDIYGQNNIRMRIEGLSGMTPDSVGNAIEITGAAYPQNNGRWQITSVDSPTSVTIQGSVAIVVGEPNNGQLAWTEITDGLFDVQPMMVDSGLFDLQHSYDANGSPIVQPPMGCISTGPPSPEAPKRTVYERLLADEWEDEA